MRKLIRYSVVAFVVWALTTFAWAALSHVTGVTGPAAASGASLDFVARAVTFVDPPGILGAPQRFAARQIRQASHAVERLHRGPERAMGRLVDALGHRHRHDGHRHVHRVRVERPVVAPAIPIDELDRARTRARARAIVELRRHRDRLDRERVEIRRDLEQRERERIERSLERVQERIEQVRGGRGSDDLKRRLLEKLREILRDLERDLSRIQAEAREHDFDFDFQFDWNFDGLERLEGLEVDVGDLGLADLAVELRELEALGETIELDGPVRIHIRER